MLNSGAITTAAAAIQASRASGVIVSVGPDEFLAIVHLNEEPLVVHAQGGFLSTSHRYLTSYRGLAFFTRHSQLLLFPDRCLIVEARHIWVPGA